KPQQTNRPTGLIRVWQRGVNLGWVKSSFSRDMSDRVEIQPTLDYVLLRDSKYLRDAANDPTTQPVISIAATSWQVFLAAVSGEAVDRDADIPSIDRTENGGAVVRSAAEATLTFTKAEWDAFIAGIQAGEFSLAAA
ncbi:DUF397 domain-containing protein, partial [Nocardia sp. JCM 34519]